MLIEINDRLYNELTTRAEVNYVELAKYVEKTLRDKLVLDKYGDLNEKIKVPEIKEDKPKKTRKKTEPKTPSEVISEPISESINEDVNGDKTEEITEEIKPKRKTKVISSK